MRIAILVLSSLGTLFFGAAFAISLLNPILIEQTTREITRIQVERKVGEKIDTLSNTRIGELARKALGKTHLDADRVQQAIAQELPRKVANTVADMLNADCECRKRLARYLEQAAQERLSSLPQVQERLVMLIEATYAKTSSQLLLEFRIVTASNALAFALLGILTLLRRRATLQLLLLALVLVGAVVITGGIYLFKQNWLHAIVFAQYVGFAYLLYLAGVALLLADVAFNRARVSTTLVNSACHAVGATASAVPC